MKKYFEIKKKILTTDEEAPTKQGFFGYIGTLTMGIYSMFANKAPQDYWIAIGIGIIFFIIGAMKIEEKIEKIEIKEEKE